MHITFTDAELSLIDMKPFKWVVKDGASQDQKRTIERKLRLLDSQLIDKHKNLRQA